MSPAEQAAELCKARGGNFREEVEAFMLTGFMYAGTDAFIMAKPMPRSGDTGDIWAVYPPDDCDAWYVWSAVGSVTRLWSLLPYPLPWLGWWRQTMPRHPIHWQPTEEFKRRLERFSGWMKGLRACGEDACCEPAATTLPIGNSPVHSSRRC